MQPFTTILKKFWPNKIRNRLIFGITLILLLLLSIFVFVLVQRQQSFLKKQGQEQATSLGETFAANAGPYLLINDVDAIQKLVQSYKDFPHLKYAMILSYDETVLAHTDAKYLGTKPTDSISKTLKAILQTQTLIKNNHVLDVAVPILDADKEIIGWARIGLEQEYIHENLQMLARNGILFILLAITISSVFIFLIGGGLIKGLYQLIFTADKIKSGERNIRADEKGGYEISKLGTAFNQMLDELLSGKNLSDTIINGLPGIFYVADKNGKMIRWNKNTETLFGYSEAEVAAMRTIDFVDPKYIEFILTKRNEAFEKGKATGEVEIITKQKQRLFYYITIQPIVFNDEQCILGMGIDFTEKKKAEEESKRRESELTAFFDNADGAACLLDTEKKYVIFNRKFIEDHRRLINMDPVIGDYVYAHFPPDLMKERHAILDRVLQGKKEVIDVNYKLGDKRIYYRTSFSPVITEGKVTGITTYSIDLTEIRESEIKLRKVNHDIGERVKELRCLYRMSELSNDPQKTMQDILQECVDIIPPSYQYPKITTARIIFGDKKFVSEDFLQSVWKQEAYIKAKDERIGLVEVFYTQQMPEEQEGPFLKEERLLINSIADILGSAAERRKAETVIKEQAETFRAIIENTKESIFLISPSYKLLQFNRTAKERIFKTRSRELYIGADFRDYLYPASTDIFYSMFEDALRGKHRREEIKIENADDDHFWIQSKTTPVYDPTGKLIGVTLLAEDIDDRKKAEAELRESEEKFRSLVEQNLVGVYILQDGRFKYVNPGFQQAIGYSEDMLLNKLSLTDMVHEDDMEMVEKNYVQRLSGKNPPHQYIFRAIKNDGSLLYLEVIASTIIYEGKPAVIGTLVDITDRVEEAKRMDKAVNDAQEKERMQIGMELHDNVKQIMAASLMGLDMVKHSLDDKKMAGEILNNIKGYVSEAINELRRLSHQLAPSIDTGDTLSARIEKLVHSMNVAGEVNVSLDIDEFEKPVDDDTQLTFYRILQEQFNNILKYAKTTSVLVRIKLNHDNIVMLIKDDGIGFSPEDKKDGIGLENIRRRANVLGGQVKIISSPGNGCEVNVQIPISNH